METSSDPPTTTTTTAISAAEPPDSSTSSPSEPETLATTTTPLMPQPPSINPNSQPPQSLLSTAEPPDPSISSVSEPETLATTTPLMPSPPSINPNSQPPQSLSSTELPPPSSSSLPPPDSNRNRSSNKERNSQSLGVPYTIPPWSQPPSFPFSLEVLKDGSIIDQLDVTKKGAYMFGRIDLCDFVLEHPTISRFHAVLQFKGNGDAYLYDLGSTHGTFINKNQVKKKVYVELHVGDVIRFGLSSRLYIFQGPSDLMLPEADVLRVTYAKDREASLRRARENAALADGISWGMGEDAIEEAEDDPDEITWQNYKGELTEKQQKTREKVLKRMEKIAHMKKEISAIRAKDIAQGGLTQGQQTQVARNEMRISQIMEELESLEETLNDSIRESIGARAGKSSFGRQKGAAEDDDEFLSDDDEFYDRTIKKPANRVTDRQSIETADSLLDKKEALIKDMDEKRRLLSEEKKNMSKSEVEQGAGDALDAFMSGLSTQIVHDRTVQLEKDLSSLQTELDRIVYLLKVADPTGEAAKKRQTTAQELKSCEPASSRSSVKRPEKPKIELKEVKSAEKASSSSSTVKQATSDLSKEGSEAPKPIMDATDSTESKPTVCHAIKPQWLGAVEERERKESQQEIRTDNDQGDEFVDYKDRKKILESSNYQQGVSESDLESAAPGLILRKKKQVEKAEVIDDKPSNPSTSGLAGADMIAEDAVALLLKHKRGLYVSDEDVILESHDGKDQKQSRRDNKRPRRVLGPEKPTFLENNSDYETWVPPEGQSGDGRTSLNDRLGY